MSEAFMVRVVRCTNYLPIFVYIAVGH